MEVQEAKNKDDSDRDSTRVSQLKRFGKALKSTFTKFGNDPIEVISFFDSVEKEFGRLRVPDNLRSSLIKPFLNDRAKLLLTQIDSSHSDNYAYVKDYLLNEFKLVPCQLLNDYNHLVKQPQQTFKAYMARLRLLLTYYLNGRKVNSLADMVNLFLCDRLKANLPESMLTHVLRVESALENGAYLAPDDLVTLLDNFASTFDKFGQPKLTPYVHNQRKAGDPVSGAGRAGPTVQQTPGKGSSSTVAGTYHNPGDKACYRCGSQSHLANKCSLPKEPHTNGKQWVRSGAQSQRQSAHAQSAVQAKAYRCVVNETDASKPVLVVNEGTRSETVADSRDVRSTELTQPLTIVCENNSGPSVNVCLQAKRQLVHDVDVGNNVVSCELHPQESYNDGSVNDNRLQLAQLNYVEIKLPLGTVSGLIDSGSELNVIRQDIIHGLDFDPIGEVEFRGIIGEPVRAPIIRIPVRLNDEVLDENDNVSVMFAVCANLNESCILSIPTLCSLTDILNSKSCVDSYNICDNIASDNSVSAVLTRSQAREQESLANTVAASSGDLDIDTSDVTFLDIDEPAINVRSDIGVSNATEFSKEQLSDVTLAQAWQLARLNKSHYFVRDNLLFRTLKRCEQELELLVVPTARRDAIVRMAHADSHFSPRRTKENVF